MRTLAEALHHHPLFFEAAPISHRVSAARQETHRTELVRRLEPLSRLDALDVPELVDENHEGKPYYRSGDPRVFGRVLHDALGLPAIVNKVVAHLSSSEALKTWVSETLTYGIRDVILVGGSSRYIPYPGPTVVDANRLCRKLLAPEGGLVGNIAIPQRTGEAHRMLAKTRAGASFFTTQIVLDAEAVARMLVDYDRLCRAAGLAPAPVLISVAALADEGDAEFVRWLGADISERTERNILAGDEPGAVARSIEFALSAVKTVGSSLRDASAAVPLGVNVEQISQRHLEPALKMAEAFGPVLDAL